MTIYNGSVTRKLIHKAWEQYMISQYAAKYGEYNKKIHSIRHEGQIVIKDKDGRKLDILEEVGMDYSTFRMKFGTSDNPTWKEHKTREVIIQLELGKNTDRVGIEMEDKAAV
jgi:hypothetical protein